MPSSLRRAACLAFAAVWPCAAVLAQDDGEFSAHGHNVVRIETEAKLTVPNDLAEEVWTWLSARYRDCSFLDRDGHRFRATFGDEHFIDRYFDTPDLAFLEAQSGARHRSRIVMEGSAAAKDGRQLVQLKLNRNDVKALERAEIKFPVDPEPGIDPAKDRRLLALVDKDDRPALAERIAEFGADPAGLRPILTIEQNRRRVYISDQHGAFATITLDKVTCHGWWQTLHWTEVELELNEIRYTEADAKARAAMNAINEAIQADLVAKFPAIRQDQTPKYNKGFAMLEAGMPLSLPLRRLIAWKWSPEDVLWVGVLVVVAVVGGVVYLVARRKRRFVAAAA